MKNSVKPGDIVEYEKTTGETIRCEVLRCEMGCTLRPLDGMFIRFVKVRKVKKVKGV